MYNTAVRDEVVFVAATAHNLSRNYPNTCARAIGVRRILRTPDAFCEVGGRMFSPGTGWQATIPGSTRLEIAPDNSTSRLARIESRASEAHPQARCLHLCFKSHTITISTTIHCSFSCRFLRLLRRKKIFLIWTGPSPQTGSSCTPPYLPVLLRLFPI